MRIVNVNVKELVKKIGYCGLVCSLCHESEQCAGCKSNNNCCGRHLSDQGCYQYDCSIKKGVNGCWECEQGPCDKDMFSENHDIRNRAFIKVARNEGVEILAEYVLKNQQNGILYGWKKDYDNLGEESAVIDLLHNGINSKYAKNK